MMPMIQSEFYAICIEVILVLVLLLVVACIVLYKHRGSNDTTRQLARIIVAVFLFCSIFGTTFIMLSYQIYTPSIHVHRTYQDPAVDRDALANTEAFNYTAVIGALPDNTNIFPPYHFENETYFMPFVNLVPRSTPSINYYANISHPNATVNMTARMKSDFGYYDYYYQNVSIAAKINDTWHSFNKTAQIYANITWLIEIQCYFHNGSTYIDMSMLIGLNVSSDVIFIARELMEYPISSADILFYPFIFIVLLAGMPIFLLVLVILEINYGWQSIKTPPRRVTAENVMDNDTRKEIVEMIREHPGITFSSIKRAIHRSPRTLLEHLGVLQRFNVIRSRDIRTNTAFFDASLTDKEEYFQYFLANIKFCSILRALQRKPCIDFITLQNILDESRSTLMRKIRILEKFGIISITRTSGRLTAIDIADVLRNARKISADDGSN